MRQSGETSGFQDKSLRQNFTILDIDFHINVSEKSLRAREISLICILHSVLERICPQANVRGRAELGRGLYHSISESVLDVEVHLDSCPKQLLI